eukprot:494345_1
MNSLILNTNESQYGYVIIVNNSQYLLLINRALYLCLAFSLFILAFGILNICWQIRYDITNGLENLAFTNGSRSEMINETKKISKEKKTQRTIKLFAKSSHGMPELKQPQHLRLDRSQSVGIKKVNIQKKTEKNQRFRSKTVGLLEDIYGFETEITELSEHEQNELSPINEEKFEMKQKEKLEPKKGDKVETYDGKICMVRFVGKLLNLEDEIVYILESIENIGTNNCYFAKLNDIREIYTTNIANNKLIDGDNFEEEKDDSFEFNDYEQFSVMSSTSKLQINNSNTNLELRTSAAPHQSVSYKQKCLRTIKECHLSKKSLLIVTIVEILIAFVSMCAIWEWMSTKAINTLLNDIMSKHEYNEIADEVINVFDMSDKIKDLFQEQYEDLINENDENAIDKFFISVMTSFLRPNDDFAPYMIYVGLPDGGFRGGMWDTGNDKKLYMTRRDENTNWTRIWNEVTDGDIVDYSKLYKHNDVYDPRCRPWYKSAIKNCFSGNIHDSFPHNLFNEFLEQETVAALTTNCEISKKEYMDFYNVKYNESFVKIPQEENQLKSVNNGNYSVAWSRYVFAELATIGLTASSPIIDKNGKLVAVVAIDFILGELGDLLAISTSNKTNWLSWITEANAELPAMIASSDGITVVNTQSVEGCLSFSGVESEEQRPYLPTEHPEYLIRVMSKQILQVAGRDISMLPINSDISQQIKTP